MLFSCRFPDVQISGVGTSALVTIAISGDTAYSEMLYPGSSGIVLVEMRELVEPYARQSLTVPVVITAEGENGTTQTRTVQVLYCAADMGDDLTAQEFYQKWFLSTLMGPKLTALGRMEKLNYYGNDTAEVTAMYSDGTSQTFVPTVTGGNDAYKRIDVSPDQYVEEGKTLVELTVTAGLRSQRYIVEPERLDCAPILGFINSFGVEELVYCTGLHQVTPDYKRSMARVGRYQRVYRVEETRSFKADTGILNAAMADWVDELLRSDEVWVYNYYNGRVQTGREVVITESKSDRSNDDAELPRITFTYQYAQRNHNVLQLYREGRIFDNTFDDTFN